MVRKTAIGGAPAAVVETVTEDVSGEGVDGEAGAGDPTKAIDVVAEVLFRVAAEGVVALDARDDGGLLEEGSEAVNVRRSGEFFGRGVGDGCGAEDGGVGVVYEVHPVLSIMLMIHLGGRGKFSPSRTPRLKEVKSDRASGAKISSGLAQRADQRYLCTYQCMIQRRLA